MWSGRLATSSSCLRPDGSQNTHKRLYIRKRNRQLKFRLQNSEGCRSGCEVRSPEVPLVRRYRWFTKPHSIIKKTTKAQIPIYLQIPTQSLWSKMEQETVDCEDAKRINRHSIDPSTEMQKTQTVGNKITHHSRNMKTKKLKKKFLFPIKFQN